MRNCNVCDEVFQPAYGAKVCDPCVARVMDARVKQAPAPRYRGKMPKDARKALILDAQGGRCAVCGTTQSPFAPGSALQYAVPLSQWNLDHDHACCAPKRKTLCGDCDRGVLCRRCNTYLVAAAEDPMLGAAIAYLERYKDPNYGKELVATGTFPKSR